MKKLLLLSLLLSALALVSCTSRKNRLVSDTLTVAIDPKSVSMYAGETKTFTALVRDGKSNELNASVTWSLDPASFGTLSAASGKTTIFTPASAGTNGRLLAEYSSVKTSTDITIKSPGAGSLKYALLTDTAAAADLTRDPVTNAVLFNYFDTFPSVAPWQIAAVDAFPGCPVDSVKCTRVDYSFDASGTGWGGFSLEYIAAKNITAYSNLTFYVKGSVGGEKFKVGIGDGVAADVKLNVPDYLAGGVTTSWQKVTMPLAAFAGINLTAVTKPLIVAFEDPYTGSSVSVFLDCIGFE